METVDVDAIHEAREVMRTVIAKQFHEAWRATYADNQISRDYNSDAELAGQRALKNAALSYLAATGEQEDIDLVAGQYRNANNMTDRQTALILLGALDVLEREAALEDFYSRFRDDDLVVNKWLSAQAMSPLPRALDRVKALLEHESFTLKNPNKVYALIGGFIMGNPVAFHRKDGSGYAFLADRLIELDSINPQVAGRMVDALTRWRRQDAERQNLMKAQLERIRAKDGLSPDLTEKIGKSLD